MQLDVKTSNISSNKTRAQEPPNRSMRKQGSNAMRHMSRPTSDYNDISMRKIRDLIQLFFISVISIS